MRVVCRMGDGEDRVLGCWGWMAEDISCSGLKKETDMVVRMQW